jgi:hypothetical protein
MPAWARVAAAAVFIGVGLGLANVQVRSNADGLSITTGWRQAGPGVAATAGAPATSQPMARVVPVTAGVTEEEWRRELSALEETLRREIAASRITRVAASGTDANAESAAMLRRVAQMIEASEERQQQAFARNMIQVDRQWRSQRYADLQNINRSVNGLQSRTFAVQANQQELLRRASLTQPNQ